jgi:hypothetical protein
MREHGESVSPLTDGRRTPQAAWLALPVATVLLATALLLARLIVDGTWERVMTHNAEAAPYARYRAFRGALPQIVSTPNNALLIGVCYSEKGFIPEAFDERLAGSHGRQLTTFSIATASMHTTTLQLLVRTIRSAYHSAGTRPELVLIELSPSMLVAESSEEMAGVPAGYNRALQGLLIRDVEEWARTSARSASFGAEILGGWVLGGLTRTYTSELFCSNGLSRGAHCQAQAPGWWPWPSQDGWVRSQTNTYRVWSKLAPALLEENGERALSWSLTRRGYIRRIPDSLRREHETYAETRAADLDEAYIADYNRYDRDAVKMFSVEGEPFQQYLTSLQELESLGTKVIVYIAPKASHIIAGPKDAQLLQGFFDAATRKIHALGIPVVQMNSMSYTLDEFRNTWALLSEDTGAPRFSRELADIVDAILTGVPIPSRVARLLQPEHPGEEPSTAQPSQDPFWRASVAAQP